MPRDDFKTKKSEQTYERVLVTACELFVERGYEKTTMRDISKASGLGLGALYYYFNSKEDVVISFYEQINLQVTEEFRSVKRPFNMAQGFEKYMQLKLKALAEHRNLLRVIMKESVDPDSPICPLNKASHKPLELSLEMFVQMAREEKKSGQKEEEIQQMARALWMLHMSLLAYWIHDRSEGYSGTQKAIESATLLLTWTGRFAKIPGFSNLRMQVLGLVTNLFDNSTPTLNEP